MKIGIYGGSFDPIHNGHIYVAESAIKQCHLDKLLMMPSFNSPNKTGWQMTDSIHRIQMCKLATRHNPLIEVDEYEANRKEVSYTYLTMQAYKEKYNSDELFYILGADSIDYFDHWVHPEIIAECATIIVIPRVGFSKEHLTQKIDEIKQCFPAQIQLLDIDEFTVSSTKIKEALRIDAVQCPKDLNPSVFEYIKDNHLYHL